MLQAIAIHYVQLGVLIKYTDTILYAVLNKRVFFWGGGMNYYLFALMDRLHKKD